MATSVRLKFLVIVVTQMALLEGLVCDAQLITDLPLGGNDAPSTTSPLSPLERGVTDPQRNLQLGIFYACIALTGVAVIGGVIRVVLEAQEIQLYAERRGSRTSLVRSSSSNGSGQKQGAGTPSQPTPYLSGQVQHEPPLTSVAPGSPGVPMTPMSGNS